MAGSPSEKGEFRQNAGFTCCLHSWRARNTSHLRTERTGNSSQLGTRRFEVLRPRKPKVTVVVNALQERYYRFLKRAGAHHASSRPNYSGEAATSSIHWQPGT